MRRNRRISAGGIVFRGSAVLLVRYPDGSGGSYLVAPGGAVEDSENVVEAIIRETREETGVIVRPKRVVVIEDLETQQIKMIKVWMICDLVEGEARTTEGSRKEGITEVSWFTKSQLADECVYPQPLMEYDWNQLQSDDWQAICLPTREAKDL